MGKSNKIAYFLMLTIIVFLASFYTVNASNEVFEFPYTGDYQEFVAPVTGTYKIELWGAYGTGTGYGGYTSGNIELIKGQILYIYVGEETASNLTSTFNGGTQSGGGRGGGGATDVRLVKGETWQDFESLKSRIMVAAGGGTQTGSGKSGAAGGLTGYSGGSIKGGTQTSHGGRQSSSFTMPSFGVAAGGCNGGNGYYPGGAANCTSGGGGGSSFISGHEGCDAIAESSTSSAITHTGQSIHYSGMEFTNTIMIDGLGYLWTTAIGSQVQMPSYEGEYFDLGYGNRSSGYARITAPDYGVLDSFEAEGATIVLENEEYNKYYHKIYITEDTLNTELTAEILNSNIYITGLGNVTLTSGTTHYVTAVDENGILSVYYFEVIRKTMDIEDIQFEEVSVAFENIIHSYSLAVANDITSLTPIIKVADGITYTIVGNDKLYIGENEVKITFTDGITTDVYTFTVNRIPKLTMDYSYTGDYQEFIAPYTGKFKIELWGAYGYAAINSHGYGGYTSGIISLNEGDVLYLYVGGHGISTGGYNGGGVGGSNTGSNYIYSGGGGATDVRLVSGTWNDFESLKSRIMVAGGGGGGSHGGYGGSAGGLNGYNGVPAGTSKYAYGYGGTQTAGGAKGTFSWSGTAPTAGSFGSGGKGNSYYSGGGGGGYYGGGGSGVYSGSYGGAGGGSSFISGHEGCDAIDESSTSTSIVHTGQSIHYSGKTFTDTVMIDGEGYSWTTDVEGLSLMPNPEGDFFEENTGNTGDGYARISAVFDSIDESDNNTNLVEIQLTDGTLEPGFSNEISEYTLNLNEDAIFLGINAIPESLNAYIIGNDTYEIEVGEEDITITVVAPSGDVRNISIHVTRTASTNSQLSDILINGVPFENFDPEVKFTPGKYEYKITVPYYLDVINLEAVKGSANQAISGDGIIVLENNEAIANVLVVSEDINYDELYQIYFVKEKTTKLKSTFIQEMSKTITFVDNQYNYDLTISSLIHSLEMQATPYYEGVNIEIVGNKYIGNTSKEITITSTLEGLDPSVYTLSLKIITQEEFHQFDFPYTGDYQTFIAPVTAYYDVELWGGQGNTLGYGGYTKGAIFLNEGDTLYVYVGGKGIRTGGYNGGGGTNSNNANGGGGATDVRLVSGTWNDFDSLKSRIMVAAGGGGTSHGGNGGPGGGLTGYHGVYNSNTRLAYGYGGTQTAGGAKGTFSWSGSAPTAGSFGAGGRGNAAYGGGGGGGYYGGGGSGVYGLSNGGGGGGSSFISGHEGSNAISEASTANLITHTGSNVHYSGKSFINTLMIDGYGYSWTDEISEQVFMPDYAGAYYDYGTGNTGDGYARIKTSDPVSNDNYLDRLIVNDGESDIDINFEPWTQTYEISLTKDQKTLTLDAVAKDEKATIEGLGTFDIPPYESTLEVVVTAENGEDRPYTLKIYREPSSNPFPLDIKVKRMNENLCKIDASYCVYEFSQNTISYKITLPFSQQNIEIAPVLETPYQKVTYRLVDSEGNKTEVENSNGVFTLENETTIEVEIMSEDGSQTSVYTYNLIKDGKGNHNLMSLKVTNPVIEFEFNARTYEYYLTISGENDFYEVEAIPENPNAKVDISGNTNLKPGMNDCIVKVTAENGDTKTYIIHMFKEFSSNVFLSSLDVKTDTETFELIPTFNKLLNSYTVTVPSDVSEVTIDAKTEVTTSKVTGIGSKTLTSGVNEVELIVTSERGDVNTYVVSIVKAKNNNSKLANLEVEGYEISPEFTSDTKEYYLTIPKDIMQLKVIVTPEETTTTYTVRGNNNLNKNLNEIVITSIAEDKTYTVYKIYVTKEMSTNNYLSGIKITGGDPLQEFGISEEDFDKDTLTYGVTVGKDISTVKVEGTAEDDSATIVGNGSYALIAGDNIIPLTVTNEIGEERVYTLTVTKPKDDDATLKEVLNNRGSIVTKLDESNYVINVQNEVNSIEITGIANSSLAKVAGNGTYTLVTGDNPIELIVTAEDGITVKKYTVNVVRDKSSNDDLDFLYVEEGGLSPRFNETIIYYEVKVPNDVELLTIEAIPEDPNATYEIIGNDGLEVGVEKEIIIRVTAEDEENTKDYTLKVIRQAATEENLSLENLETNRGLNPTFSPDTLNYYIEVENDITDITVTAKAFSETVTVLGPGTYDLQVGKNAISVFVIGESGVQRDYQIVVERKKSSDATLSSLVVKGSTLSPSFDKKTTEYKITTSKTKLEFTTIKTTEAEATYEIIGNADFGVGENEVIIRVTAPDGTTKDYTITVTIEASGNNNLASLEVEGYTLTPTFHKGVTYYTTTVGNDINTVLIKAEAEDEGATISGTGVKNVSVGTNTYEIVVTSAKGTEKKYVVAITKDGSSNNYLSSLYTSEGTLTPDFNKETLEYYVTVGSDISTIEVDGTLEVITASTTGFGTYSLNDGLNEIEIPVISESGDIRIYKIYVTKKESISANIIDLKIAGYDLDQTFDKDITEYFVNVNNETTELNLNITLEDENATYEVTGNENFTVGMNEVYIVVTAKDGETKKTYTLFVNRNLSTNNYLSILEVSEGTLTPEFKKETLEYKVEVGNDVTSITISAQTEDSTAQITSGLGEHQLIVGENTINVKVKSSIGVYRTYIIKVTRKKSENNYLSHLTVKGNNEVLTLNETFDKTKNIYTLSVDSSIDYIQISGTKEDAKASLTGNGIKQLKIGTNIFEIKVTSESGATNTYTLTVEKEASSNNNVINIIPSVGTLNKTFDPSVPDYELTVAEDDNYLSFEVELEDTKSVVSGASEQIIAQGESERIITITAENGDTKTYTFKVIKESTSEARLESLKVEGYEFEFDPDTFVYNLPVSAGKKELLESEIEAIAKDVSATVNLMGDLTLINDTVNIYVIEVIAKDGYTTQEYRLNITTDNEEYTLRSEVYEINRDEEYVIGSNPNTNVTNYISNFENDPILLVIYDKDGNKIEDVSKLVGTSMTIKLEKDGVIYDSLKVIVRGDVTKDGKVDLTDQIKLENYVGKAVTFDDDELMAAEVTKDGKVNLTDQVELENYVGKAITDLND